MLTEETRQRLIDVLNTKYFELSRFCEKEKISRELVVYSRHDCFAVTKENVEFYAHDEITEEEIEEYATNQQISFFDGSILLASRNQEFIIEVIDLEQSGIEIIDPRDYFKNFFNDIYAKDCQHFRIIKAPLLNKFVKATREQKFLDETMPRNFTENFRPSKF